MLKTLIKKQLLELFQNYVIDKKTGRAKDKKKIVLTILLGIALFFCLCITFFSLGNTLGAATLNRGVNWLYFALMGLLSIALGVFGSVFNTYASLYLPKDNDTLLSLPIPPRTLLTARLGGVYATSLLYSGWIWLPACVSYWVQVPMNPANVLFPILLTFVLALFVTVLSCLLGWLVALVATRARGKSFLTVALSLLVMGAYYVVYFRIVNSLNEILANLDKISSAVKTWLYYVYLLGSAADGNLLTMLLITAITLALAGVTFFILTKTFLSLAQQNNVSAKKEVKASEPQKQTPPKKALLKREFAHFTATPTWMLNGGLGILILPLIAIYMVIKHEAMQETLIKLTQQFPEYAPGFPIAVFAIVAMVVSLNTISAASVSLEGKSLWVMQTLPVNPWDILQAKEQMSVLLNAIPAALTALVIGWLCGVEFSALILILVTIYLYATLIADFGLFLNLRHPNLHWTNVMVPCKQSIAIGFSLLGGWLFCLLLSVGAFMLCNVTSLSVSLVALIVAVEVPLYLIRIWLRKKGTAILSTLS